MRKSRLTIGLSLILMIFGLLMFIARYSSEGLSNNTTIVLLLAPLIALFLLYIAKWFDNYKIVSVGILLLGLITIFIRVWTTGGIASPVAMWLISVPILATMILNRRVGIIFAFAIIIYLLFLKYAASLGFTPVHYVVKENVNFFVTELFFGLIMLLVWLNDIEREFFTNKIKKSEQLIAQSEKLASMGQIASDAAHEINNPLTIIQGKTTILSRILSEHISKSEHELSEKVDNNVRIIQDMIDRVSSIVRSMKIYSSNNLDKMLFNYLSVKNMLQDVIQSKDITELITADKIKIELKSKGSEYLINGDSKLLQLAISSLLRNAIHSVASCSDKLLIVDIYSEENETLILSICYSSNTNCNMKYNSDISSSFVEGIIKFHDAAIATEYFDTCAITKIIFSNIKRSI